MKKYMMWMDSLVTALRAAETGKDISYRYWDSEHADRLADILPGDLILGYYGEPISQVKNLFRVKQKSDEPMLILEKLFETAMGTSPGRAAFVSDLAQKGVIELSDSQYAGYIDDMSARLSNLDGGSEIKYDAVIETELAHNRVVFGAPGTGKSFSLNREKDKLLEQGGSFERVTFHPDYSYAHFVGTYKPVPRGEDITYSFVAGPFIRTWIRAIQSAQTEDPKPHVLLIEEINRANVAAVFCDIFQLLDRDERGVSEYPIQTSKELREYLAGELNCSLRQVATLKIPANMFIWATMNSADQGVFPMDTAFKRRWDFTYIGIDENQEKIAPYVIEIAGQRISWNRLRVAINARLTALNINEDELLGPFFIKEKILKDNKALVEALKSKVIMYLFEDAAKQRRGKVFYQDGVKYSDLCQKWMTDGVKVFHDEIYQQVIAAEETE